MKLVNNFEHQVLKLLGLGIRNTQSIYDALTEDVKRSGYDAYLEHMYGLQDAKTIVCSGDKWAYGVRGFSEFNHYEMLAKAESAGELTVAAPKKGFSSLHYDGAELLATCLRKGAYDYLACPSLVGGQRVMHRTSHLATLGA